MLNSVHKVNRCRQEKFKTKMCADLTNKRAVEFFDYNFFTITTERNFDDATTVEVHEHFLYTAKLSDSLSSYWREKQGGRSLLMGDIEWLTLHPDKWGVTEHCKRGLRPIILLPIIDPNTHVQTLKPHCTVQLHS